MTGINRRRLWGIVQAWGPVLALLALIFITSAQPKNPPPHGSESRIYLSGALPVFPGGWDGLIKKSSHIVGYGALALLSWRALRLDGVGPLEAALLAVVLAVGYGLADEWHQSFVRGRRSSLRDVGFDAMGAALAVGIAYRFYRRRYGFK